MRDLLEHLFRSNTITEDQARTALLEIVEKKHDLTLVASFLTVFRMRPVTVEELLGFREALLSLCTKVDLGRDDCIDMCGTGGDGKDTFNISTLASFIAAGAGVPIAKHGNYGVSSICGSSHVLESLGVRFHADQDLLRAQLEQSGICFFHAPLFHPAMKEVAPVRRALGIRTIFNLLGPLCNPARVKKQVVGVFSLEIARLYSALLQKTADDYAVVHALDGYDEISLTGPARVIAPRGEEIVSPVHFGADPCKAHDIESGGTIEAAAQIFMHVLDGVGTVPQKQVACANAALAIRLAKPESSYEDSFLEATESVDSGRARECFQKFSELSRK